MNMNMNVEPPRITPQPAFNLPGIIVVLAGLMLIVHLLRVYVLAVDEDQLLVFWFAFLPARYLPQFFGSGEAPGGLAADLWTFVTYAFLHGGWMHLILNLMWMASFGSALAWRFGTVRFLLLSALCAASGALMHLLTHYGSVVPVIGASAIVSGHMGAALRFVFVAGGPLAVTAARGAHGFQVPAVSLRAAFSDARVLGFMGAWFGLNLLFGLVPAILGMGDVSIAWEAHIGGFLAGLLLFSLLDPVPARGDYPPSDQG